MHTMRILLSLLFFSLANSMVLKRLNRSHCSCGLRGESVQSEEPTASTKTNVSEFPWRCSIRKIENGTVGHHICGCTILSTQWILTAAHCTHLHRHLTDIVVDLGDHDLKSQNEPRQVIAKVAEIFNHEHFNSQFFLNDISLIRLATPVTFASNIGPVCLPYKYKSSLLAFSSVVASGWHGNATDLPKSNVDLVLRKMDLWLMPLDMCKNAYKKSQIPITKDKICTYHPSNHTTEDHQEDSGGSIDLKDVWTGRYYAIGVVAFSNGHSSMPGVYTDIRKHLDWIGRKTSTKFCG